MEMIDISEHQGEINFSEVKKYDKGSIGGVIIRATYGIYQDARFVPNRDAARAVGLKVGFYHYAYPQINSPEAEADVFCNTLHDLRIGEFLALDFEEKYADPVDFCKRFIDRVAVRMNGYRPLLYVNMSTFNSHNWSQVYCGGWWFANPDGNNVNHTNQFEAIKQYSWKGRVSGINGEVDLDMFWGGAAELQKFTYQKTNEMVQVKPTETLPTTTSTSGTGSATQVIVPSVSEVSQLKISGSDVMGWVDIIKDIGQRYTSRKFIMIAVGVALMVLNKTQNWDLSNEQIITIVTLIGGYVIVEGVNDIRR